MTGHTRTHARRLADHRRGGGRLLSATLHRLTCLVAGHRWLAEGFLFIDEAIVPVRDCGRCGAHA